MIAALNIKIDIGVVIAHIDFIDQIVYQSPPEIDSVVKILMAPPQYVGSSSTIKYLVKMCGQERTLYLEDKPRRWFIEKPVVQFV